MFGKRKGVLWRALLGSLIVAASAAQASAGQVMRGVNLFGLNKPGEQMPRLEAIDYYRSKGFTGFRIPVQWELIQPKQGGPLDQKTVDRIRSVINRAGPGATIVLEIHNFGRFWNMIVSDKTYVKPRDFANLWTRMVQAFPDGNIVYGLMNEPHDEADADVVALMNSGLAAIRQAGRKNLVLVSGNKWSNRASFGTGASNWAVMSKIVDPGNNWAIDYHIYLDSWSAGTSSKIDPSYLQQVQQFTVEARARHKRAFVGEWAVAGDTNSLNAGATLRRYMEANPDVFAAWFWWGGGGWWKHDYLYLLDPYGSQWDASNPDRDKRIGGNGKASTWEKPLRDKPQMSILY